MISCLFLPIGENVLTNQTPTTAVFSANGVELMRVTHVNPNDPFQEGIEFQFEIPRQAGTSIYQVLLDRTEACRLRDTLNSQLETP
jgi:hypothetical protein